MYVVLSLLFRQLRKDPQVLFTGYKNPHPLEHKIILRIQTTSDYSPQEALTNAITDLISEVSLMEERFRVCHFCKSCFCTIITDVSDIKFLLNIQYNYDNDFFKEY